MWQRPGERWKAINLRRLPVNAQSNTDSWRPPASKILKQVFQKNGEADIRDIEELLHRLTLTPSQALVATIARKFAEQRAKDLEIKEKIESREDEGSVSRSVSISKGSLGGQSSNGERGPNAGDETLEDHDGKTVDTYVEVTTEKMVVEYLFGIIFLASDNDGSGFIDHLELAALLTKLGYSTTLRAAQHCIAEYDMDKSGTIESAEFCDFMMHEYCQGAPEGRGQVSENGSTPWLLPVEGKLKASILQENVPPCIMEVSTDVAVTAVIKNIQAAARTDQEKLEMFRLATEDTDFYMTAINAQAIVEAWTQASNGLDKVEVLECLLPQMVSSRNVVGLVENNCDYLQKLQLRKRLGVAWGVLVGNETGSYSLNLEKRLDRLVAKRIAMANSAERQFSQLKSGRADTSQKGNWNNFRNESLDGRPMNL
ncbi:unnamed protein product, partial [Chrysoparadoxa australica]